MTKNITYKSIRNFLLILLVAASLNLGLFLGLDYTQQKLGNYLYQSMTAPFLAPGVSPEPRKLTTKPLQIEYMVLKVPTASKTAAKK